ncbi:MAG: CyaA/EF/ExoY family adenylyl cyclase toxin [Anaerolineales bacterium]|nr:CyaA/EF/ExoY family adenylyl cyclase toxin [Anaerolineales bacterium]
MKASFEDLKGEGIPRDHAEAFLGAADYGNSVILTRTPGISCGGLLAEGYDGKCFHIKGKSCNWGPMAGFVCLDPLLNKNGIWGALGNLSSHYKSFTNKYEGNTAGVQHIKISASRLAWLTNNGYIVTANKGAHKVGVMRAGLTNAPEFLGRNDIQIPYLFKREAGVWAIYYDRARAYLNAVTGDYDLFALWPHRDTAPGMDSRMAGMRPDITNQRIIDKEHGDLGNITNRVYEVGQIINSQMAASLASKEKPNRVFHSDEAGRPFIDDVDLPAAAFMPKIDRIIHPEGRMQMIRPSGRMYLISTREELSEFILRCHGIGFRIYINKGWQAHLKVDARIISWC